MKPQNFKMKKDNQKNLNTQSIMLFQKEKLMIVG